MTQEKVSSLVNSIKDTAFRNKQQIVEGETPVKYRYVFEFNEPVKISNSGEKVEEIEFFGSSDLVFYALQAVVGRLLPSPDVLKRAQAIILTEESSVTWQDRNPGEEV